MDILERFPNQGTFNEYWNKEYKELTYEDVREAYENTVKEADGHIFISDYEEKGCVSKEDFKQNLSRDAQFMFQDSLIEAFYDKNPKLYETAFEIYEIEQMSGDVSRNIACTFHETYRKLYNEFLDRLFDEKIAR